MCTFNVNGLNEKGGHKMRDLMKWATEKTLDVIFIQEHTAQPRDKQAHEVEERMQTTRLLHHPWHTHTKNGYGSESPQRSHGTAAKNEHI